MGLPDGIAAEANVGSACGKTGCVGVVIGVGSAMTSGPRSFSQRAVVEFGGDEDEEDVDDDGAGGDNL